MWIFFSKVSFEHISLLLLIKPYFEKRTLVNKRIYPIPTLLAY
jgi:hypothetical protein